MILCNFSNTDYSLEWYDYKWRNLNAYLKGKTDGIELFYMVTIMFHIYQIMLLKVYI